MRILLAFMVVMMFFGIYNNVNAREGMNIAKKGKILNKYDIVSRRKTSGEGPKISIMYMGGAYLDQYSDEAEEFYYERCRYSANQRIQKLWIKGVGNKIDNLKLSQIKVVLQNNEILILHGPFWLQNKTSVVVDLPGKSRCVKRIKIIGESDTWWSDKEAGFRLFGEP